MPFLHSTHLQHCCKNASFLLSIHALPNHVYLDNGCLTKKRAFQSLLRVLCCLCQEGIEITSESHRQAYTEAGLAKQDVQVSIYTSTLKVEYEETELALYTIAWHEDNKHITEVSNPRVIETSYRSPQLTLWTLGPDEWLLFKKLPDYAPRTRRKTIDGDIIQLPLPDIDESQKPPLSFS